METLQQHLSKVELEEGLPYIRETPKDNGVVRMIVRRPDVDQREVVEEARLDVNEGLVGDTWKVRSSKHTPDGSADFDAQITIMNSRVTALLAQSEDRWPLAGDQLYVDIDLSQENLPAGTRLSIGSAVIEISPVPHNGCVKFSSRFGVEAHKFVNSKVGNPLRLRGVNARIVQSGSVRLGNVLKKL